MLLSLCWSAVRGYRLSMLASASFLLAFSTIAGLPPWLPLVAWLASAIVLSAAWWVLEPSLLRLSGARRPGDREQETLTLPNQLPNPSAPILFVRDDPTIDIRAGLRSIVVTRGLLEVLDQQQLGALVAHATAHIRAGDALGPVLVWLGALPMVALWCVTRGITHVSRLLAYLVGIALIVPALLFPVWFRTWFGGLLAAWITMIVGLWLVAVGLDGANGTFTAVGAGLLVAWLVVPGLRALAARDARRREPVADHVAIEAGLDEALESALEVIAIVEPSQLGRCARSLGTRPPTMAVREPARS
jgi:Zn-dependent protease with chaperone function